MAAADRVTYVIGELGKGGAEYQLYELLRAIDRRQFIPSVVVLATGGYWAAPIRALGIEVIEVPRTTAVDMRRVVRLRQVLRRLQPDILQTIRWSGNSYGRIAAIGLRIPVIIASERVHETRRSWVREAVDRLLDRTTDAYLVNCSAIAAGLSERLGVVPNKIRVITNGIDLAGLPPALPDRVAGRTAAGLPGMRRLVAGVGRLTAQKDFRTFLAAAAEIAREVADVDFLVVGDGEERQLLEATVRAQGLDGRVRFLGLRHDVPTLLRGVDVLLMTSVFEGFPNALLEAMAMGVPVVATDVGGCRELVQPGATGLLVAPRSPHEAAQAVVGLLRNPEQVQRLATAARKRIEREFTVGVLAARTGAFYRELRAGQAS